MEVQAGDPKQRPLHPPFCQTTPSRHTRSLSPSILGENSQPLGKWLEGVVGFVSKDKKFESFPDDKSFSCPESWVPL